MKPIIFNAEMVKAILEGRKTQTRRPIKLPKYIQEQGNGLYTLLAEGDTYENQHFEEITNYLKPSYQPGDMLYVRETWQDLSDNEGDYIYFAGGQKGLDDEEWGCLSFNDIKWRSSRHMPKEAARIFLKVTNIRVERMQDITEDDAKQEGIRAFTKDESVFKYSIKNEFNWQNAPRTAKEEFKNLWNEIYKNWNENSWVWVIEFECVLREEE